MALPLQDTHIPAHRSAVPPRLISPLVRVAKGAAGFVVVAGVWELACLAGIVKPAAAPSAAGFMSALVTSLHAGALAATAATIEAWGITVLVSVAIGCVIGLLTGIFAWLDAVTSVFFDFARTLPPIAILPAVIVIVGVDPTTLPAGGLAAGPQADALMMARRRAMVSRAVYRG